jgi:hypothetical protein
MLRKSTPQDVLSERFLCLFGEERVAFETEREAIGSDVQKDCVFQDGRERRTFASNHIEDCAKNT